jgi:hypothetical protein
MREDNRNRLLGHLTRRYNGVSHDNLAGFARARFELNVLEYTSRGAGLGSFLPSHKSEKTGRDLGKREMAVGVCAGMESLGIQGGSVDGSPAPQQANLTIGNGLAAYLPDTF